MDREKLLEEIAPCSIEELKLIIETQTDLYTPEEMDLIKKELRRRTLPKLPETIICPKCDGMNPFQYKVCQYCGLPLDKEKYYRGDWDPEEEEEKEDVDGAGSGYGFHYVISFIIPLVGFIVGAILLGKDSPEQRSVGKICIILGLVSIVVAYLLWSLI